ncbi:hypothetical protein L861_22055 [Litchfieldella anticariensis FP35 = DSM 16096]|uniref:Uncharacterized protein n=1 Tax=Litchfieldella anticariensis (strain DSM 16096 / CECT 5854 / CIP 108499 / LMG 22089 / FP35) TaxID=1121939 RepID=S2KLJ1_LITA3|nr:hypothetical protein L861_22055 [Halomonas anticariensis FP35 = DSM 16096]
MSLWCLMHQGYCAPSVRYRIFQAGRLFLPLYEKALLDIDDKWLVEAIALQAVTVVMLGCDVGISSEES